MTPKAQAKNEKIHTLDLIKIKNFHDSRGTVKKVKRQHTDWEKNRQIIDLIGDVIWNI